MLKKSSGTSSLHEELGASVTTRYRSNEHHQTLVQPGEKPANTRPERSRPFIEDCTGSGFVGAV